MPEACAIIAPHCDGDLSSSRSTADLVGQAGGTFSENFLTLVLGEPTHLLRPVEPDQIAGEPDKAEHAESDESRAPAPRNCRRSKIRWRHHAPAPASIRARCGRTRGWTSPRPRP